MNRRGLIGTTLATALLGPFAGGIPIRHTPLPSRRPRPGEPAWPTPAEWARLNARLRGSLSQPESPFDNCRAARSNCDRVFQDLRNPYAIRDSSGITQSFGWIDAWTSGPSAYAIAAENATDVAAAVRFAGRHNLRLVVKGGGHSYQGTSNAIDSLLVWTRKLTSTVLHEDFRPLGCSRPAGHAVSLGAGVIWQEAYDAVTTKGGRYVQGGGCSTVGVAGLITSGGFGTYSKGFGSAAAHLLEAEVVTADGQVRLVNHCRDPDLFWALKGGGSTLGVITRMTLRTHPLPAEVGAVNADILAKDDVAFAELIELAMEFCRRRLVTPNWGEQLIFRPRNIMQIRAEFQGISRLEAAAIWEEFFAAIRLRGSALSLDRVSVLSGPAREAWNPAALATVPGAILRDARPDSPPGNIYWAGDGDQVGQFVHGYASVWLPARLLDPSSRRRLVEALAAASAQWKVSLHLNKGLAGAPPAALAATQDTATNPAMLSAFCLAILGAEEKSAFPGVPGHEPNLSQGRQDAARVRAAAEPLRKLLPEAASYLSESDYFEQNWQQAFWGPNYPRLARIKQRYDPYGLFFAHHMVGSERWSPDGFERVD